MPLVFGERNLGVVGLGFRQHEPLRSELVELLVALGQQVTLALALKRLFHSSRQAAVLAERNRLGREIHDGLAQAFTGIPMQINAVEEQMEGSPLAGIINRVRDIAREGLTEARRSVLARRSSTSSSDWKSPLDCRSAARSRVSRLSFDFGSPNSSAPASASCRRRTSRNFCSLSSYPSSARAFSRSSRLLANRMRSDSSSYCCCPRMIVATPAIAPPKS